jgi:hypothetical protein
VPATRCGEDCRWESSLSRECVTRSKGARGARGCGGSDESGSLFGQERTVTAEMRARNALRREIEVKRGIRKVKGQYGVQILHCKRVGEEGAVRRNGGAYG